MPVKFTVKELSDLFDVHGVPPNLRPKLPLPEPTVAELLSLGKVFDISKRKLDEAAVKRIQSETGMTPEMINRMFQDRKHYEFKKIFVDEKIVELKKRWKWRYPWLYKMTSEARLEFVKLFHLVIHGRPKYQEIEQFKALVKAKYVRSFFKREMECLQILNVEFLTLEFSKLTEEEQKMLDRKAEIFLNDHEALQRDVIGEAYGSEVVRHAHASKKTELSMKVVRDLKALKLDMEIVV